jgi:hypothetical protein
VGINTNTPIGNATTVPNSSGTRASPPFISDTQNSPIVGGQNFNQKAQKLQELQDRLAVTQVRIDRNTAAGIIDPSLVRQRNDLQDRIDTEFGRVT